MHATHDIETEMQAIGYMLVDSRCHAIGKSRLRPMDFFDDLNREAFRLLFQMNGRPEDMAAIKSIVDPLRIAMIQFGLSDTVEHRIAEIINQVAHWIRTDTILGYMAYAIGNLHRLTRSRKALELASLMTIDPSNRESQLEIQEQLAELDNRASAEQIEYFDKALVEAIDDLDSTDDHLGYGTGLAKVDENLGGLHRGEMCVLAGLSGKGKTAFALNVAAHNASKGRVVVYVALEMTTQTLTKRVLSSQAQVNLKKIFQGRRYMNDAERKALVESQNLISSWPLAIRNRSLLMSDIERDCQAVADDRGRIDLIIVDYLQLIRSRNKNASLHEQTVDSCLGCLGLAKRFDAHVLLLSQLNREAAKDSVPRRHQLRNSGTIEQDADQILLIYPMPEEEAGNQGVQLSAGEEWVTIDVAKNRRGPEELFRAIWKPATQTFSESPSSQEWEY